MLARVRTFFALPLRDVMGGLDRLLDRGGAPALVWMALGLVAGWWLYVPLHELLHAVACMAAGGSVSRLEIAHLYGGGMWAAVFPFVSAGSEYAGRLSGFDTRGSDLVYLATDCGPYLLTLWPGVWALRRAARFGRPLWFGAALPVALAPLVSLTGDAYEIGSILATRVAGLFGGASEALAVVRGDDLLLVLTNVAAQGAPGLWWPVLLAAVLAALWAWGTYGLAGYLASVLREPATGQLPTVERYM